MDCVTVNTIITGEAPFSAEALRFAGWLEGITPVNKGHRDLLLCLYYQSYDMTPECLALVR